MHLDILDKQRRDILKQLENTLQDFVLGGGTALALQIRHRKSFDFDFFDQSTLKPTLITKINSSITIKTVSVDTSQELTVFTKDGIKLTFLHYPFPSIFQNTYIQKQGNLQFFTIPALAAQKAYTVGRRGEYRDYFDVYSLLKKGYATLDTIIKLTEKIYGSVFNPKLFLEQLTFFDDMIDFHIEKVDSDHKLPSTEEVKSFLEKTVDQYVKNI